MAKMKTWREILNKEFAHRNDSWDNVVACTLSDAELDEKFNAGGWGDPEGKPFTLWTKDYVYFPVCYDGAEWAASVPRNPNGEATDHVGGY